MDGYFSNPANWYFQVYFSSCQGSLVYKGAVLTDLNKKALTKETASLNSPVLAPIPSENGIKFIQGSIEQVRSQLFTILKKDQADFNKIKKQAKSDKTAQNKLTQEARGKTEAEVVALVNTKPLNLTSAHKPATPAQPNPQSTSVQNKSITPPKNQPPKEIPSNSGSSSDSSSSDSSDSSGSSGSSGSSSEEENDNPISQKPQPVAIRNDNNSNNPSNNNTTRIHASNNKAINNTNKCTNNTKNKDKGTSKDNIKNNNNAIHDKTLSKENNQDNPSENVCAINNTGNYDTSSSTDSSDSQKRDLELKLQELEAEKQKLEKKNQELEASKKAWMVMNTPGRNSREPQQPAKKRKIEKSPDSQAKAVNPEILDLQHRLLLAERRISRLE